MSNSIITIAKITQEYIDAFDGQLSNDVTEKLYLRGLTAAIERGLAMEQPVQGDGFDVDIEESESDEEEDSLVPPQKSMMVSHPDVSGSELIVMEDNTDCVKPPQIDSGLEVSALNVQAHLCYDPYPGRDLRDVERELEGRIERRKSELEKLNIGEEFDDDLKNLISEMRRVRARMDRWSVVPGAMKGRVCLHRRLPYVRVGSVVKARC
jgi:hypothetical protein